MAEIRMRNVGDKMETLRAAKARAILKMQPETFEALKEGNLAKGDAFLAAQLAGIQAAKMTSQLLPLCHPLPINWVNIVFLEAPPDSIEIIASVETTARTGVEMEALTAVGIAALTIYDMAKPVDKTMEINGICLLEKSGGRSGKYVRGEAAKPESKPQITAVVLTVSDSVLAGHREDLSGPAVKQELEKEGVRVSLLKVLPDEQVAIVSELESLSGKYDFIFLTGGTGVSHRDVTPEAVSQVIEKDIPGVGELLRQRGESKTPFAFLSRSLGGIKGKSLIICLPGSPSGARDGIKFLFPHLLHALPMLRGEGH